MTDLHRGCPCLKDDNGELKTVIPLRTTESDLAASLENGFTFFYKISFMMDGH